ncbi:MAG TPA: hypothetical protein VFT78_09375 [Hanamia sp.]|nr:hypothetical protein [Hanamia sp.]
MDRVSTLLNKLQKQLDEKSSAKEMLQTVQILQAELIKKVEKKQLHSNEKISVLMPVSFNVVEVSVNDPNEQEEKVVQLLEVDEKEIEEELQQIKKKAEAVNARVSHNKAGFLFDPLEEVPTLAHQDQPDKKTVKELNELSFDFGESLNDRLKESKVELSQSLTSVPIKDLRKAIGVNDRFLFINELFRGDEAMYERSIKTIQNFSIYAEAEFWIRRELKVKIGWHDSHPVVKQFDQLVKRRFA